FRQPSRERTPWRGLAPKRSTLLNIMGFNILELSASSFYETESVCHRQGARARFRWRAEQNANSNGRKPMAGHAVGLKFALVVAPLLLGVMPTNVRAQSISMTPDLQKIVDAAKKEGSTIELANGANTFGGLDAKKDVQEFFKANFGIDLQYNVTPGGPM